MNAIPRARLYLIGIIIGLASVGLFARLIFLHVSHGEFLQSASKARTHRSLNQVAYRGVMTDRNGEALAVSTPVYSAYANPDEISLSNQQWFKLSKLLDVKTNVMQARVDASKKQFVYLKRHFPPQIAKAIEDSRYPGVYVQKEYRRFYPSGEVTAHIIGKTNIDHQGIEGLELKYNNWLQGLPGTKTVLKDGAGQQVEALAQKMQAQNGKNIVLSLDNRIQYLAYRELLKTVSQYKAKAGSVVAIDIKTGEILALVNQPSFNPNLPIRVFDERYRNRALTDVFEPGSVLKAFSVANLLENGPYNRDSKVNTHPGRLHLDGQIVRDARNHGTLNIATLLQKSSNVGISKLSLSMPKSSLVNLLYDFGFGQLTGSGFPGESSGQLRLGGYQKPFSLATLSFGYGVSVTPMQLARAYATLANDGVSNPLTFLKRDAEPVQGHRVISKAVAKELASLLNLTTLSGGTGRRAAINGIQVAGKTGTSIKFSKTGYDHDKHIAVFAGFAPKDSPKVALVVVIDEPQGAYYGGQVAAPAFARIMDGALRYGSFSKQVNLQSSAITLAKSYICN